MSVAETSVSSVGNECAVASTVRLVREEAVHLLHRRSELNRRIRELRRLIRGLQYLADPECDERTSVRRSEHISAATGTNSHPPVLSRHCSAVLKRACRIALLDAGGAASTEEIQQRIVRRGSFSFADARSASTAILKTLESMTDDGELFCTDSGQHLLWQRTVPAQDANSQQHP